MTFPISIIPYANVAPYHAMGPPPGCRFVYLTPKASINALIEGKVMAAPVPVGGLSNLVEIVDFVGKYGIAAAGEVISVLFFSRKPFTKITAADCIELTDHSASSVRLLYLLLGYYNGFHNLPHLTPKGGMVDGRLVIGDTALQYIHKHHWPHVTDLGALWSNYTNLPFVFARWVVRKDAPAQLKSSLLTWLNDFAQREPALIELSAATEAQRLEMTTESMRSYLKLIRRTLGPKDLKGQSFFQEQFKRYKRDPLFLPGTISHKLNTGAYPGHLGNHSGPNQNGAL